MKQALIALIAAGLASSAIAAEPRQDDRQNLRQKMYDKMRSLESQSHRGRIQILQEAEGCIQGANSPQTYRECERKEQTARESLRESLHPQQQALRDEFQRMRREHAHEAGHDDGQADKP